MRCEQIQPNLLDYATGHLSEPEARQVEDHLRECAECTALMTEEVAFSKRLSDLPVAKPINDAWPAISAKITPRFQPVAWLSKTFATNTRRAAAAAAALAVMLISVYGLMPHQQQATVHKVSTAAVTVKWSDDPLGDHTDAMINYIDRM